MQFGDIEDGSLYDDVALLHNDDVNTVHDEDIDNRTKLELYQNLMEEGKVKFPALFCLHSANQPLLIIIDEILGL